MTPDGVRQIRKRLGLTQQRFAELVGVSWTTVKRWEIGERNVSHISERLIRLIAASSAAARKGRRHAP